MNGYLKPAPENTGEPLIVFVYRRTGSDEIEVVSVKDAPLYDNYPSEWQHVTTLCAQHWMQQRHWQPIATAPTDGTFVDVVCDGVRIPDVNYRHDYKGWYSANNNLVGNPTHWMRLPEPPTS